MTQGSRALTPMERTPGRLGAKTYSVREWLDGGRDLGWCADGGGCGR